MRLLLAAAAVVAAASEAVPPQTECALGKPQAECLSCHRVTGHVSDFEYPRAGEGLRSPEEVVRRGVFLREGQIRCATCHDARSPWKYRIALPPGAKAVPAVDPFDRATYDGPPRSAPKPGEAVSAKPLCLACHALD